MPEYVDKSSLGTGGFAEVVSCERTSDGAVFAKKILKDAATPEMIERFQQEVRILAKLHHPNVIRVIDSHLDAKPYWYVMPQYRASLRDELSTVIGNNERTRKIFDAILNAVEHAHNEGVLHRDLKARNVMLNNDDDVVVTDFGIGRILDADGDRFTMTGQRFGSGWYASPEQLTDTKHVDLRADIYSLGRMLYELFTEPLNSAVQDLNRVPPNFIPIVERCTKYHPRDRYQTVAELREAWQAANEATSQDGGVGEAKRLLVELAATPDALPKVEKLLKLLEQTSREEDLLKEAMMTLPAASVSLMFKSNPQMLRGLVKSFVGIVLLQGAGPPFHEKLSVRCGNLFVALTDPQIRAELLFCNLIVGVKYKRQFALENLANLLQSTRDPSVIRAIEDRLKPVSKETRAEARKFFDLDEFDPKIASLFRA